MSITCATFILLLLDVYITVKFILSLENVCIEFMKFFLESERTRESKEIQKLKIEDFPEN